MSEAGPTDAELEAAVADELLGIEELRASFVGDIFDLVKCASIISRRLDHEAIVLLVDDEHKHGRPGAHLRLAIMHLMKCTSLLENR